MKYLRKLVIAMIGGTVVLIGVALIVLPGPAFIVIPVGLAILATEYAWARRWLKRARRIATNVVSGHDRAAPRESWCLALRLLAHRFNHPVVQNKDDPVVESVASASS